MDRRVMLFIIGAIAAAAMYPVVAPLDAEDPSNPQHFGITVLVVVMVYAILALLFLLENISKRRDHWHAASSPPDRPRAAATDVDEEEPDLQP
jgi:hypothetical protein